MPTNGGFKCCWKLLESACGPEGKLSGLNAPRYNARESYKPRLRVQSGIVKGNFWHHAIFEIAAPKEIIMRMNVNLTPQLEAIVQQKISSGLYASASEVVREVRVRCKAEHVGFTVSTASRI